MWSCFYERLCAKAAKETNYEGLTKHTGPKRHIIPAFLMSPTHYNISAKGLPWAGQDSDLS